MLGKDTNDFLSKLKGLGRFPDGAILVTIDVVGLYPHIPHNEGLEAIRKVLNTRSNPEIPTDDIVGMAELVLRNNNFEFDGNNFLQKEAQLLVREWRPPTQIYLCTILSRGYWIRPTLSPTYG